MFKKFFLFSLIFFTPVNPLHSQWLSVSNGLSGYTSNLLYSNNENLYAGNYNGISISTNDGIKWSSTSLTNFYVRSLFVDNNNIYAGGKGMMISTNNGVNFTQSLPQWYNVRDIKKYGDILYAACAEQGVFISSNNGISWEIKENDFKPCLNVLVKNNFLFVGCHGQLYMNNGGVFKSSNNGNNWVQTSLIGMDIDFLGSNSSFIFAGNKDSLFKSNNNGDSWSKIILPSYVGQVLNLLILNEQLYLSAYDNSYSQKYILLSEDNGNSWNVMNLQGELISIAEKSSKIIASIEYYGVYISSDNGLTWDYYLHNDVSILSIYKKGTRLFAGSSNYGMYFSDDDGFNWKRMNSTAKTIKAFTSNDSYLFAGVFTYFSDTGGVYRSSNNGLSWEITSLRNRTVNSLHFYNSSLFAGETYSGIKYSTNNGNNWSSSSISGSVPYCITHYSDKLFTGLYSAGIYYSTNIGASWIQTSLNNVSINNIAGNSQYMFASSNEQSGLYYSSDQGINWQSSTLNKKCWSLVVSGSIIVAGTTMEGVYISTDNGLTWRSKNENLSSQNILSLLEYNEFVFAGLSQNGLYRRTISDLTDIQQTNFQIPKRFELNQNYPNPFNPSTKISFNIPKKSFVNLKVYDITGKLVQILINEYKDAGFHEVLFDLNNLSTGIYFYKLDAGEFSRTRKMTAIK